VTTLRCIVLAVPLCVGMLSGCDTEEQAGVPEWLGEDPHFRVIGTVDGESLDIGEGGTIEVTSLECEREYIAPLDGDGIPDLSQAQFTQMQLMVEVLDGDETRIIELEFKPHDLQSDAIGTEIEIIPRLDTDPPDGSENAMWFEWQWEDQSGNELLEISAQDGLFTLELFTGEPGPGGVVIPSGEGSIGGHLSARWSPTNSIEMSFTAPCVTVVE
jgi:hypothetical protein